MSDPVSSRDVEDVLSSIRRLVSEEAKGNGAQDGEMIAPDIHEAAEAAAETALAEVSGQLTGTPPSNDEDPGRGRGISEDAGQDATPPAMSFRHQAARAARRTAGESGEKLVLTADFRISDPGDAEGADAAETGTDAAPATGAPSDVLHLHPVPEPDLPGADDGAESPADRQWAAAERAPAQDRAESERAAPEADASGSAARPDPFAFASEDTLFDRARAAMEAGTAEAPGTGIADAPPTPREPEPGGDTGLGPFGDSDAPDPAGEFDREAPAAETPQAGSPFSATGHIANAPTPPAEEAGEAEAEQDAAPERINFVEEEESILDEDTLRDMVSEMVRQELQGELGDRITRNVRKLVRREIQRALASRAFE